MEKKQREESDARIFNALMELRIAVRERVAVKGSGTWDEVTMVLTDARVAIETAVMTDEIEKGA